MADFSYTAQDVNGDPASSGRGINIVKGQTTDMVSKTLTTFGVLRNPADLDRWMAASPF